MKKRMKQKLSFSSLVLVFQCETVLQQSLKMMIEHSKHRIEN